MSTWNSFYLKVADKKPVIDELKILTGIENPIESKYPDDLNKYFFTDVKANPDYLVIGKTQPDWVTVSHNSLDSLSNWAAGLSKKFDTIVIVVSAQSVSDYYYFSLFEHGNKLREIEVCYSNDSKPRSIGKKFPFENDKPGSREEVDGEFEYFFGFEEIEAYCKYFGLTIQTDYENVDWTILKQTRKSWWKFW